MCKYTWCHTGILALENELENLRCVFIYVNRFPKQSASVLPTMISWENSQNTDIALHTMKENASFGTGLHLGYCFDVKKTTI